MIANRESAPSARSGGRVADAFAAARAEGRAALVTYLTYGDPSLAGSMDVLEAVIAAGSDVIELGVPFSDPSADGPSIQAAMARALDAGAGLSQALSAVAELRRRGHTIPVVLFGYYNPIFVMGAEAFAARAAASGVDAVLTVDLPLEELGELAAPLAQHHIAVIPLVAPTSTAARIARVAPLAAPFVYYISMTGVTGAAAKAAVSPQRIDEIRAATAAPVAVGFGIRTPAQAAAMAQLADGVVVGSALVDEIADGDPAGAPARVAKLVSLLRAAVRR
ncbi:MAG: tryptophan synthase subunit alpha [Myxococcales bacterium]|jgi:tryptophan synthase alpha chain|nr:tryptophan synthase subunit alpha [Myxococcales bacterium]